MQSFKAQNYIKILLGFTFTCALVSQSAMDIGWALLLISIIALAIKGRSQNKLPSWLGGTIGVERAWAAWIVIVVIGYVISQKIGIHLFARVGELCSTYIILYLLFTAYKFSDLKLRNAIDFTLKVMIVIPIVLFIISFGFIKKERMNGVVNPMAAAHSFGLIFVILGTLFLSFFNSIRKDAKKIYLWVSALALMVAVLLVLMTRGVWIGVFVAMLIVAIIMNFRLGLALGLSGLLFAGLLMLVWPGFQERVLYAFDYQSNYDSSRVIIWQAHWDVYKESNPWFGAGYGENSRMLPAYYEVRGLPQMYQELNITGDKLITHAHNQFLHMLAGTGIIGLIVYLLIYGFFLKSAWGIFKTSTEKTVRKAFALGIFGTLIAFLIGGLTESNYETSKTRMILLFIWALIIYLKKNPQIGNETL